MATNYTGRTVPTSTYSERTAIGGDVMAIIQTGFWDSTQVWENNKFWVSAGGTSFGTLYTTRPTI